MSKNNNEMTKAAREEIVAALKDRKADRPCERCGAIAFTVLDRFVKVEQHPDLKSVYIAGPMIPCAAIVCNNCGNVNFHALGPLGLMHLVNSNDEGGNNG